MPTSTRATLSLLNQELSVGDHSVFDALTLLRDTIQPDAVRQFLASGSDEAEPVEVSQLRTIIPEQKIAPLTFEILNGKITLAAKPNIIPPEDLGNVRAARAELVAQGARALEELEDSNCDKRLVASILYLQEQLLEEGNIVQLGLSNLAAKVMCDGFHEELPIAVASMLGAYTRGVDLYVSQYPEWNRFLENAGAVKLDNSDVVVTHRLTRSIIKSLEQRSDLVDPRVPKTLARLNEFLQSPGTMSKRAAFAVLRSIENLVSSVFSYGTEFLAKTATRVSDDISLAASKVIVVGLLTLALGGAAAITPVAGKISEMGWIKNAVELVERQLKRMSSD